VIPEMIVFRLRLLVHPLTGLSNLDEDSRATIVAAANFIADRAANDRAATLDRLERAERDSLMTVDEVRRIEGE
jgi:hypothetical protein